MHLTAPSHWSRWSRSVGTSGHDRRNAQANGERQPADFEMLARKRWRRIVALSFSSKLARACARLKSRAYARKPVVSYRSKASALFDHLVGACEQVGRHRPPCPARWCAAVPAFASSFRPCRSPTVNSGYHTDAVASIFARSSLTQQIIRDSAARSNTGAMRGVICSLLPHAAPARQSAVPAVGHLPLDR